MTKVDLARISGINRATILRIEEGGGCMLSTAKNLARRLAANTDTLCDLEACQTCGARRREMRRQSADGRCVFHLMECPVCDSA